MRVSCPQCRQELEAPADAVGRKAKCAGCRAVFIPDPSRPAMKDIACPACGEKLEAYAIICLACGLNLQTGRRQSASEEPPRLEPPEEEHASAFVTFIEWIGSCVPGLFRPLILISALVLVAISAAVIGMSIFLMQFAVIATAMMGGAGLLVYAQAVALLLQGEWGLLYDILADIDSRRWAAFFVLMAVPFVVVFGVIKLVMTRG